MLTRLGIVNRVRPTSDRRSNNRGCEMADAITVLTDSIEAFNAGDWDSYVDAMTDDTVYVEFGTNRRIEGIALIRTRGVHRRCEGCGLQQAYGAVRDRAANSLLPA